MSESKGKVSSESVVLHLVICWTRRLTQSCPYSHLLGVRDRYPSLFLPSSLGASSVFSQCVVILADVTHLAVVVASCSFPCRLLSCHTVFEEMFGHLAIKSRLCAVLCILVMENDCPSLAFNSPC